MEYELHSEFYKGETVDNCHRIIHMFSDGTMFHAVYNLGEKDQYIAYQLIEDVQRSPDDYLFTPYIEFIDIPDYSTYID